MGGFESLASAIADAAPFATSEPMFSILLWLLGVVFLWSGIAKVRRPTRASVAMVQFGILRQPDSRAGRVFGMSEIALGVWLFSGIAPSLSLALATILFAAFSVLVIRSLRQGDSFACFCFGSEEDSISKGTVARNLALLVLAGALTIGAAHDSSFFPGAPDYLQILSCVAIGLSVLLLTKVSKLLTWNRATIKHLQILSEPEE